MLKLSSLRRITTTGNFIPEVDSLRFVAIVSVVLCHLCALLAAKSGSTDNSWFGSLSLFLINGRFGVQLFFVISGLILALPFCKMRMNREKNLHLKSYYLRRLTRIEPPYILVMIVLFFASVYVAHSLTFDLGLKSLGCSLVYIHNFVFGRHVYPYLTTVAWSLEVEIQFYMLMPLLSLVFLIRPALFRRSVMIAIIILFTFLSDLAELPFFSLYDYLQYFMLGFLLADFYYFKDRIRKFKWAAIAGYLALICIWLYDTEDTSGIIRPLWHLLQIGFVFVFYYVVLFQDGFRCMKNELIIVIGGMCYSVYLLHYPIISLMGSWMTQIPMTGNVSVDNVIRTFIISIIILIASAIFFALIERPCMNKNWPQDLMKRLKQSKLFGTAKRGAIPE